MARRATTLQKHMFIPMRDGTRLAACVHWPARAPSNGRHYPAIFEYHPYRKDDRSAPRAADHEYFARHGFVSIRLDVRGTGSSEGVNTDEYMPVETRDGYDTVEWLASQPWSNGSVGMFGSSYGGFTCFQVASLQPPHLKAVAPIYATDDRYTDDCHYKGGAFKAYYDVGTYGTMMIALNALPPDPDAYFDWEARWRDRLEKNEPYMEKWLANQIDGPYWRPGSLRGQYRKVKAATFVIGGWQDGYPNPLFRTYSQLSCPKKLLVGPWNHSRPSVAIPGPRIDYLREIRRWFDLWLKGKDDGILSEPPVTYYVQSYDDPEPARTTTTGNWRSENAWPVKGAARRAFWLGGDRHGTGELLAAQGPGGSATLEYDPTVGIAGGLWSGGLPFGLPGDQRQDEARSLVFTSPPLRAPLTVAGYPRAQVFVSSSAPVVAFVVKVSDVAPDGRSALVTRGYLNGTRRDGMHRPAPMNPGSVNEHEIEL
ncbi:MAG: CocE/NonD family hydrolase, partial [Chloroflexi bacterium]|nr:CocE/NonD family hydrolase [Chloroflexota bacterium]